MVRMVLEAYSAFRTADFEATVIEMGLKEFGEQGTLKAYIEFDDGGAPLTYGITAKGVSMLESQGNGKGRIKNFGVGAFVEQAKKLGYSTYIDDDLEMLEFGTVPDLVGCITTWKAEKGKKRIDAEGNEKEGYINFVLVGIKPNTPISKTTPIQSPSAAPALPPAAKQTEPQAEQNLDDLKLAWMDVLQDCLTEPKTVAEIQKHIISLTKNVTPEQKKQYAAMATHRTAILNELKAANFITVDENLKISLVG